MATKPQVTQDKPNPNRRPKPAASRASEEPTSASEWKKSSTVGTLVAVPSGKTVRVRTPGMQVFLSQGVIPNGLLPLIQEAMKGAELKEESVAEDLMGDPEKLREILDLADAVSLFCFIEPKLHKVPLDDEGNPTAIDSPDRDPNLLYVDEVDLNDKLFVFQFAVGGTASLENFRQE